MAQAGSLAHVARSRSDIGWWVVTVLAAVAAAVATLARYTVAELNADGVEQSVASVQDATLFFWGQDRFASVVSWVASPVADPTANLTVCLLINALAFHGLLVMLAALGAGVVTGRRDARGTALLACSLIAVAQLVLTPNLLHKAALESQPFALSTLAALGSVLLWRAGRSWSRGLSVVLVGLAVGLSQLSLLIAAWSVLVLLVTLAVSWRRAGGSRGELVGALRPWLVYGLVCAGWVGVWAALASRFGGAEWPPGDADSAYASFSPWRLLGDARSSAAGLALVFDRRAVVWLAALAVLGLVVAVARGRARPALLPGSAVGLFAIGYWAAMTANRWVELNLDDVRYFLPVVVAVVLVLGSGLAVLGQAVADVVRRPAALGMPVVVGALLVTTAVALAGPTAPPSASLTLVNTQASAQFAAAHRIRFVTGSFWVTVPTLHHLLHDGRDAAFELSSKVSGDRGAYRQALTQALAEGRPRALCLSDTSRDCIAYLDHWVADGWVDTGQQCPGSAPGGPLGPDPGTCTVLEFVPAALAAPTG